MLAPRRPRSQLPIAAGTCPCPRARLWTGCARRQRPCPQTAVMTRRAWHLSAAARSAGARHRRAVCGKQGGWVPVCLRHWCASACVTCAKESARLLLLVAWSFGSSCPPLQLLILKTKRATWKHGECSLWQALRAGRRGGWRAGRCRGWACSTSRTTSSRWATSSPSGRRSTRPAGRRAPLPREPRRARLRVHYVASFLECCAVPALAGKCARSGKNAGLWAVCALAHQVTDTGLHALAPLACAARRAQQQGLPAAGTSRSALLRG
jgi:hypothetical protein